jgi:hypothetical protein
MPNGAVAAARRTITGLSRISRKPQAQGKRRDLISKSARVAGDVANAMAGSWRLRRKMLIKAAKSNMHIL